MNTMSALPQIPYNIMVFLAKSSTAENLWKMLKYNSYDALSKPNLTFDEKISLIWKEGPQEQFNIFFTGLIEDSITESKMINKIYQYVIEPNTLYTAITVYAFDCLYGGQMSLVEYNGVPVSRGDLFINIILNTLNGAYVGGVGRLILDDNLSKYCGGKSIVGNSKTFTGVSLYMGVIVGDSKESECG